MKIRRSDADTEEIINLQIGIEPAEFLLNAITDKICSIEEDDEERATLYSIRASIEYQLMKLIKQGYIIISKQQPYKYKSNTLAGISDKVENAFMCRDTIVANRELEDLDIPTDYGIKPIRITYEIGE